MTEAGWLADGYPPGMIQFLRGATSDRKFRLFACACARWTWVGEPDERCRVAVETAERFADGQATAEELTAALRAVAAEAPGSVVGEEPAQLVKVVAGGVVVRLRFGGDADSARLLGNVEARLRATGVSHGWESEEVAGPERAVSGHEAVSGCDVLLRFRPPSS